jgi:short-subunit dehydrogenase
LFFYWRQTVILFIIAAAFKLRISTANMGKTLQDKVVIITGASSGIGEALVYAVAAQGAKIVIAARNINNLQKIASELSDKSAEVLAVQTDVSVEDDCRQLIENTISRFGSIDVLINNAGISMRAIFSELNLDVIRKLMDVNFWGTVYCTKFAMPYLLASKGTVVGVISIAGHVGLPGRTGYSASKFAVRGFMDALRSENLKTGLHVMLVAPGFTASNIRNVALTSDGSPQGESPRDEQKMMSAEAVANHIINGIVKKQKNIVLTFKEGKLTVFLNKIFPSLVSRLAFNHMAEEPDSPFR